MTSSTHPDRHALPSALVRWEEIKRRLAKGTPALFLDYDGTLTPIRARPELATLCEGHRQILRSVAKVIPSAVVSGRSRSDVQTLVGLKELAYAGSHGFDIVGPYGATVEYEVAEWIQAVMKHVSQDLRTRLRGISGCTVESKEYSVAIHTRLVAPDEVSGIEQSVDEIVAGDEHLKKTVGKKLFEVRPAVDWDKGRCLPVLLNALGVSPNDSTMVYIGDDTTDEDAFQRLREDDIGILVSQDPRPTAASFSLQDPGEVFEFLKQLQTWAK